MTFLKSDQIQFVHDNAKFVGHVICERIVVPSGNKLLGIGCHIIQLSDGNKVAVPNIRINLNRHMGRKIWYSSEQDPVFTGRCRYHVVSKPTD